MFNKKLFISLLMTVSIILGAVGFGGCSDTIVTVNFVTYCQEEIPPTEYEIDDYYRKLPTPTRDGYEFLGWFSEEVGGELIKNNNKASRNTKTLYARWVANDNRIVAESNYSLLIDDYGDLWAWGNNEYGQLGDGTTEDRLTPAKIIVDKKFTQISTVNGSSYAIDADGNLWAWGNNKYGRLGDGTNENRLFPIRIMEGTKFKKITTAGSHSLAIDDEGNLWSWGQNYHGVIGDGTFTSSFGGAFSSPTQNNDRLLPIQIMKGTFFIDIACGSQHSMAIDTDAQLWVWGSSEYGQLGDGVVYSFMDYCTPTPKKIMEKTKFLNIYSNYSSNYAVDENYNIWVWGENINNRLANINDDCISTPIQIMEEYKFIHIDQGLTHTTAIDLNGNLWAWGENTLGELGNGAFVDSLNIPVEVTIDKSIVSVSADTFYSIALDQSGNLWAWGLNDKGQFGDGTTTEYAIPIQINLG